MVGGYHAVACRSSGDYFGRARSFLSMTGCGGGAAPYEQDGGLAPVCRKKLDVALEVVAPVAGKSALALAPQSCAQPRKHT